MNQAHLHLMINHLPIMGTVIGMVVLIAGYLIKNQTVKQTALGIFIFSALAAIPAQLTGEGAEEIVEKLTGINHDDIHKHEDWASRFSWLLGGLGLLSLITLLLIWKSKTYINYLVGACFVFSILVIGVGKQTATNGGEIRHTEIKSNAIIHGGGNLNNKEKEED